MKLLKNVSSCRIRLRKVQCRCIDTGTSAVRFARFCSTEGVGDSTTGSGLWKEAKIDKALTRELHSLKANNFLLFRERDRAYIVNDEHPGS